MSRETDTSSSGPQGRGGAAYPSGTPPYGTPQYQEPSGPAASAEPEEKKTETTLTTRIRINIPGSRPIPPVVVRKPVKDDAQEAPEGEPTPESPAERTAERPAERTAERTAATPRPDVDGPTPAGGDDRPTSAWFAPRKPATGARPQAPAQGAGPGAGPRPGAGPATGAGGANGSGYAATTGGAQPQGRPGGQGTPGMPYFSDGPEPPTGPTTGPAMGTTRVPPARDGGAGGGLGGGPMGDAPPGDGPMGGGLSDDTAILTPQKPHPGPPPPQVSGDTLTSGIPVVPQGDREAPAPSPFPMSGPARTSEPGGFDTYEAYPPVLDEPAPEAPAPTPPPPTRAAAPRKKKGRSKLVLLGVALFTVAGIAYGAGLLLNQADVPKGTTVLGVDIGGATKEEAVQRLDAALGTRASTPLQLEISGKKQALAPDKAGLALDSQATVRAAAGSDYNPVSVIGSLFGAERVAQPVIPVDKEKLSVALSDLAGGSGSVTEGTITFEPGKVVAVPGKSGTVLDVQRSMIFVRDAYRAQVETGRSNVVELPFATREPTIKQDEIDRAMKEFAEPAMSGLITIKAGGKEIQFGPQRSLPQILSMKPVEGKLVPYYDKEAITRLLDGVFDGVMITKADGKKHQVSADDVAHVMQDALLGKTQAERTVTIKLDGEG
ncbi:hypothetical protein [Streptomyces sp. TRM49041]|uniref:hypothetical protein n=1 Tax=Streptomyces sp. TRM49041 TaxID=2603216 RepID=UPI001656894B|nr:hypothetical protein [Streptomyces sp. TRM49041]